MCVCAPPAYTPPPLSLPQYVGVWNEKSFSSSYIKQYRAALTPPPSCTITLPSTPCTPPSIPCTQPPLSLPQYVGVWNEKSFSSSYITQYRAALDKAGFPSTAIVAADQLSWSIWDDMQHDSHLANAVGVFGIHHAHAKNRIRTPPSAVASGKPIWASEDGLPLDSYAFPNNAGSAEWARTISLNAINRSMTATIMCPLFNGWSPHFGYDLHGMLVAREPWSGGWRVLPGMFVMAHHTYFTRVGWLLALGGGSSLLPHPGGVATPSGLRDFEDLSGSYGTCSTVRAFGARW